MITPCPASPKLIKSMSDLEEEIVINEVLESIIDNVVKSAQVYKQRQIIKKKLKYVRLQEKQYLFTYLKNIMFYVINNLFTFLFYIPITFIFNHYLKGNND